MSLPFTVANEHFWFTFRHVHPVCHINGLKTVDNAGISGGCAFDDQRDVGDIPPGEERSVPCAVSTILEMEKVLFADVDITLSYGVEWFPL